MSNPDLVQPGTPELSVVVLCYKAGEAARNFIAKTITTLTTNGITNFELLLVGNYLKDSDDITPRVVTELAANDHRLVAITLPKAGMMGWDMRSGLERARGQFIAVIDGDGQMPIEDIISVYRKIQSDSLDLVKTYRVVRGDGLWRKFISLNYNIVFKLLFPGLHSRDINAKPKIFRRDSYKKLNLTANDWFIDAEIMIEARRLGFKIGEVPTTFLGLTGRKSFVKPAAIWEFIKNLVQYRLKEFGKKKHSLS